MHTLSEEDARVDEPLRAGTSVEILRTTVFKLRREVTSFR